MNPVLILTHNCLSLTKRCVESIQAQDIDHVDIHIIDNGSTDGTVEWLNEVFNSSYHQFYLCGENRGVSYGWNIGIERMMNYWPETGHVLVINNDVQLPSWFYRSLLAYDVDFVTGVSVGDMEQIAAPQPPKELAPCPDFSAFLIHRKAWETIGPFDEQMVNYCGDMDYHIRAHRAGIHLWNAGVHFYHQRSSTLNLAPPEEQRAIQLRADEDRAVFMAKWGVGANDPGYASLFSAETFGIDRK